MSNPELKPTRQQEALPVQPPYKRGNAGNNQVMQKMKEMEEMKNCILVQVLDQSARARLNTLCLGKPDKGKMVEDMIVNMARRGDISNKLGEKELINILESVNQQTQQTTTVKFDRRRAALDSDDEDL